MLLEVKKADQCYWTNRLYCRGLRGPCLGVRTAPTG
jgi:hypothetical protein